MSHNNDNTFNNILNYFIEDEEIEEDDNQEKEIVNYEQNSNNACFSSNDNQNTNGQNSNQNGNNNDNQNELYNELYSNEYNAQEQNAKYIEEEKLIQNEEELENSPFVSFKSNELKKIIESHNTKYKNNDYKNSKENIIEKIETNILSINNNNQNNENSRNSQNQSKKDIVYNKIITGQCSFGNLNDVSNRSTSINTDKFGEFHQPKLVQNMEQEMFKPEYLINSKSFDELENINNLKSDKHYNENIEQKQSDYKNKKEKIKKNKQIQNSNLQMSNSKTDKKINNVYLSSNNSEFNDKKPIQLILYDDAKNKIEKMKSLRKYNLTQIQLTSAKRKINKKSYQLALQYEDKKIEYLVKKYSKNNIELSIISIALIFQDLKIFRKLLQNTNINKLANINNIEEFKNQISISLNVDKKRKNEELDFLEQTWTILNLEQKKTIRVDVFEGFLKIIFFAPENDIDIVEILRQYLYASLFGEGIVGLNENKNNLNIILQNYINKFYKLKENSIAYKSINYFTEKKLDNILKEKNQNLIFQPNIPKNEDFKRTITQRKKNFNFESLYNRFIQKEKHKQSNLEHLKQNHLKEELKELKQRPTITKYRSNNIHNNNNYPEKIYEKLYKMDKHLRQKRKEKIEEKNKEDLENYRKELKSCKLNLNLNYKQNRKSMAKSFDNKVKPKGYDNYINRNKKAILERNRIKNLLEKIPCGENYEKIKRRSISPFNITDMKRKQKRKKNPENEDYFTLQIKIPNGQLRTIKIYSNSDPYKIAGEFCRIYSLKDNIKEKLIKNIIECKRAYLDNIKTKEMEEEEEIFYNNTLC